MKREYLDDFLIGPQGDEDDGDEEFLEEQDLEDENEEEETELDPDVAEGRVCAVCGTEFREGHSKVVVCHDCAGTMQAEGLPEATNPEKDA